MFSEDVFAYESVCDMADANVAKLMPVYFILVVNKCLHKLNT